MSRRSLDLLLKISGEPSSDEKLLRESFPGAAREDLEELTVISSSNNYEEILASEGAGDWKELGENSTRSSDSLIDDHASSTSRTADIFNGNEASDDTTKPKKRGRPPLKKRKVSNTKRKHTESLSSSPVIIEAPKRRGRPPKSSDPSKLIQRGSIKNFVEPDLAEPVPAYTGLPLEAFPSTKIKKESLWPSRGAGRRGNKNNAQSSKEDLTLDNSSSSTSNDTEEPSVEKDYQKALKTELSGDITEESDIRDPISNRKLVEVGPKTGAKKKMLRTPKTRVCKETESLLLRSSKRIKVISPKKSLSLKLAPATSTNGILDSNTSDDRTQDNDDFCFSCGGPGIFICCDSCPKSFHFLCCDPPIDELPEDNWNCKSCSAKKHAQDLKLYNDVGIFGQLLNRLEGQDPKQFQLPKRMRESTFIGVTTGENGEYRDSSYKADPTMTKLNGAQIPGFNKNDDLEIGSLYDKSGRPYLCHKCKMSGLHGKTLIHCDYCPLVWHLDCFDTPMFSTKNLGSKWMCPNHYEKLIPEGLFGRRNFKDTSVLDISLHSHFIKIACMKNIVIKHNDQPYLKENKIGPSLQEYQQYENNEFSRFNTSFIEEGATDTYMENGEGHELFKVPDFFKNYSTPAGITARTSQKLHRVISMTSGEGLGCSSGAFIYRVPETLILLDFISRARTDKTDESSNRSTASSKYHVLNEIEGYEIRKRLESNGKERDFVDSALQIKNGTHPKIDSNISFRELVKAALSDAEMNNVDGEQLKPTEIEELTMVKKLINAKGKKALLEFLQS